MAQEVKLTKNEPDPEMLKHLDLLEKMEMLQMMNELNLFKDLKSSEKVEGKKK